MTDPYGYLAWRKYGRPVSSPDYPDAKKIDDEDYSDRRVKK